MTGQMKAGTGKAVVHLGENCFPADGFTGVHDPLCVRAILIETGAEKAGGRYAIVSADLTSMFPKTVEEYKQLLLELAGVPRENSWITVTHTFSAPHLWDVPKPGEPDIERLGHPKRTPEEIDRCIQVNTAFHAAVEEAVRQAVSSMQPVRCGSGYGACGVNASRNMKTAEGWWLGCDAEEFSDHTVAVLKFESLSGEPVGLLFVYDCQSSVMGMSELPGGGKLTSSDLLGAASAFVEREYGDGFVALALCGAAGDQEPQLKAKRNETDRQGRLRSVDLGEHGFILLEAQGQRLGAEVLKTTGQIACTDALLQKGRRDFICNAKVMERNLKNLHPTVSCSYVPDGEKPAEVQAIVIGDFALLGTRAELTSRTAAQIRDASPYMRTAVATMVDGGAKYMVDEEAYDRFTYGALNSAFMKGSAERLRDEGIDLLRTLYDDAGAERS